MKKSIYILWLAIIIAGCSTGNKWTLKSPDGKLAIQISQDSQQTLVYSATCNGKTAIESSKLGIILANAKFDKGLSLVEKSVIKSIKDEYKLLSGKRLECKNEANEIELEFVNAENNKISITLRAYNDGVAFKYSIDAQEPALLENELTEFNLPTPGDAYIAPYDTVARWAPAYESFYQKVAIGTNADPNKNGWAFPALFKANDLWVLISESNLGENYVGMHLNAECADGIYSMRLPEPGEADPATTNKPTIKGKVSTPWRFINISKDLAGIVESNLVTDLADPCKIEDTSWIKPGVASWGWWSGASARDYYDMKLYVDFANYMGWPYSLVDAGWPEMKNGSLEKLTAYAKTKDVGYWAWYPSGTSNLSDKENDTTIANSQVRKKEFQNLQDWGVKGIKVDYFVSDKPEVIQLYHDVLKDAAEHHLLVNFHGCTLPRGWRRTWPHLMTLEAVRGSEAYRYDKLYPEMVPSHLTIAAFTRNVIGPADYTPTAFSKIKFPHKTSFGFELATSVLIESGIIHFCDKADAYMSVPDYVRNFMKNVPSVWDETKFIAGSPDDYVVLARRNGDTWYIAGINGTFDKKMISLDLSQLVSYNNSLELITDGQTNTEFEQKKVETTKPVSITMLPAGGFIGILN